MNDSSLRQLEWLAAQGDEEAESQLLVCRVRSGALAVERASRHMPQTLAGSARKAWMLAYSSGGYVSQIPPSLRKSGMPLSVEIPAPVEATTVPASRMASAARG